MSFWPLMGETITFKDRLKMAQFVMTTKKFTNGEKVKEFERAWSTWLNYAEDGSYGIPPRSLYVSSGSTANFLLVAAVKEKYGLKNGDKVLLPACTWVTNVAPIIQLGLQPVFCDVNLHDFSFDTVSMKYIAMQHKDIKMVFVTHLLGFSANIDKISEIFPDALIIEDVCESHGCTDEYGLKRGAESLGATFSFYFGHHMSTIEGGMVSTDNYELYDLMKMKRSHGMARESINPNEKYEAYPDLDKKFLFVTDGYNFRNHEICAVLGLEQLKRLDSMIAQRRKNYVRYHGIINSRPDLFQYHLYQNGNSSFCFPFICNNVAIKERFTRILDEEGIEHRPIVGGNLLKHPFLKGHRLAVQRENNNVDLIQNQGLYIGNSHFVGKKHLDLLDNIVSDI